MRKSTCALLAAALVLGCVSKKQARQQQPPASQPQRMQSLPLVPASQELGATKGGEAPALPLSLTAADGTGLKLVALEAKGVVEEPLAFTQLHLTFQNPEPRQMQGHFEITLPPGATVSRFAMKQAKGWQEGEVVERQRAREVYEDFLHRRQDPALLEKKAGNQFRARVFPIPPRGRKELLIAYSQELQRPEDSYRIHLKGLPQMEHLGIRVLVGKSQVTAGGSSLGGTTMSYQTVEVKKEAFAPDQDFALAPAMLATGQPLGLRHSNLAVARVVPVTKVAPDVPASLLVLFDTSASRALGFPAQVQRLGRILERLRQTHGGAMPVRIVCFDQEVEEVFAGKAGALTPQVLDRIRERHALGASDLGAALEAVAKGAAPRARLLLVTDGIVTAGEHEGGKLRAAVARLRQAGVERLDVVVDGGIRDEALLRQLVTADLPRSGVIIDAALPPEQIVQRLGRATYSGMTVSVPGSEWVWPSTFSGLQAGDPVLVYADLPATSPLEVVIGGSTQGRHRVPHAKVTRPLLERAWVNARIQKLMEQRETVGTGDPDLRAALKKQIIELSTKHRVLSDFTALLVLETEHDYRRFNIDRKALADILVVGQTGVELLNRRRPGYQVGLPIEPVVTMKTTARPRPDGTGRDTAAERLARRQGAAPRPPATPSAAPAAEAAAPARPATRARRLERAAEGGVLGLLGNQGGLGAKGDAFGAGGLGLRGTGRGGGGTGEGTIGLGDLGTIGRGGGGGRGSGYGRGAALRERRGAPPRVRVGRAEVRGSLDKEIIRRIIRRHINEVRYCYERELQRHPTLQGRVAIRFIITPTGRAQQARVQSSTLNNARVEACVAQAVNRWRFPTPRGGGIVIVNYPFVFMPGDGRVTPRPVIGRRTPPKQLPKIEPYKGKLLEVMSLLKAQQPKQALRKAVAWRQEQPGDVLALTAMGEALEALGEKEWAARVYGSIIDLFPSRADLRRYAGARLDRLGLTHRPALDLAVDTYRHAVEQRPDHPSSHRQLAYALLRADQPAAALEAILKGHGRSYPSGRFAGVKRILKEDIGLIAAAWAAREPQRRQAIEERIKAAGAVIPTAPSLRFILTWETDANDVDFHIYDGKGGHADYSKKDLASGGALYADVTTGYGPECFSIPITQGGRATGYPYKLQAHYYRRGPMGYGMGKLQVLEHDGQGKLWFDERPFVVMVDRAFVELGTVQHPLGLKPLPQKLAPKP